jgi:hypothetical protein
MLFYIKLKLGHGIYYVFSFGFKGRRGKTGPPGKPGPPGPPVSK